MTWQEYEVMPWRLGWKHEYFNGMAHLTPRQQSVLTIVEVNTRHLSPTPCEIRAVVPADADELKRLFFEVFHDSVEYCDYPKKDIQQSAERCIDAYFESEQASGLGMSRVAIASQSASSDLIGAALVIKQEERPPLLRLLCIAAPWQRQGIATRMVATVLNGLCSTPYQ
ncbi:MAG: GNAT family N-acetyltransferase, partial [Thermosynechococcaceae cyanobacterium]